MTPNIPAPQAALFAIAESMAALRIHAEQHTMLLQQLVAHTAPGQASVGQGGDDFGLGDLAGFPAMLEKIKGMLPGAQAPVPTTTPVTPTT